MIKRKEGHKRNGLVKHGGLNRCIYLCSLLKCKKIKEFEECFSLSSHKTNIFGKWEVEEELM